jgi:transglutaminase superfamily protein
MDSALFQSKSPKSTPASLVLRALLLLVSLDIRLAFRGFPALHKTVENTSVHVVRRHPDLTTICHAVDLACVFYFKRVLCLQRSAATAILLRKKGIAADMVIGVQPSPFRAHAWVEVSSRIVNDKTYMHEMYRVMDRWQPDS